MGELPVFSLFSLIKEFSDVVQMTARVQNKGINAKTIINIKILQHWLHFMTVLSGNNIKI